jgi:hypothetical protein
MSQVTPKRSDALNAALVQKILNPSQPIFEQSMSWLLYAVFGAIALGLSGLFFHNNNLAPAKGKIGICLLIVLGAALLTAFKKYFQWIYGLGQIAAGLVSCWLSMDGFAKTGVTRYQAILFLGGSIYLLREGLETFWDGVTGQSDSPGSDGKDKPADKPVTSPGSS